MLLIDGGLDGCYITMESDLLVTDELLYPSSDKRL